jgi:hypothetical protein
MFFLAQDPKQRPSIDECVRDLEQFLAQLPSDAEGTVVSPAPLAGRPSQLPASLIVDGSLLRSSSSSSPPPPDSTTAFPPPMSPPPQQPPASLAVDVRQLSSLESSDICILLHAAAPDFEAKGYGKAAETKKATGDFIVKANEVELSTLFSQMGVDAVDMPTLREAVASWKANPAQAFETVQRGKVETARRAAEAEVRLGVLLQSPDSKSQTTNPQAPIHKPQNMNHETQTPTSNENPQAPKPQTPNNKTPNPQPQSNNPKPQSLNLKSQTLNAKPRTPNPNSKPQTENRKPQTPTPNP